MKKIWEKEKQAEINKIDRKWKENNKKYLKELQSFFDSIENIEDCELRRNVRNQMLICDKVLTEIAEEMFGRFYNDGYKRAKRG